MPVYFILLITAFFSLILASIFVLPNKDRKASTLFLATYYILISISSFQIFVLENNLISKVPWFYGWPLLLFILIPTVVVSYFISSLELPIKKWYPLYVLLFIPSLLALFDTLQWFLMGQLQRNAIILSVVENSNIRFDICYGLISLKTHYLIRNIISVVVMSFLFPKILSNLKNRSKDVIASTYNKWLLSFWILVTLKFLIWTLWSVLGYIDVNFVTIFFKTHAHYIISFFAIVTLAIGLVPFYFPSILYNHPITWKEKNKSIHNKLIIEDKKKTHITGDRYVFNKTKMKVKLEEVEKLKLYLSPNFDSAQLAINLQIPAHQLSYLLNEYFKMSFSEYRNNLRMAHAVKLIENGYLVKNTTEGLATECGFASRSSFSKNFKKKAGISLRDYCKLSTEPIR